MGNNITHIVAKAGTIMLETVGKQEQYISDEEKSGRLTDIQALQLNVYANSCAVIMAQLERAIRLAEGL